MTILEELASEAYIYGYPLVYDLYEVQQILAKGMGSVPPASFNTFAHASGLAGPADKFVSVNNDTVYSMAQIDVSGGPVELHVPDTGDRYYVLQFIDAWTNNFAYIGKRATGTGEGSYLLIPPGSTAQAPAGTTAIRLPTDVVTIVGRWACAGEADLPAIAALQQDLWVSETSKGTGLPEPQTVPDDLAFYEKMRIYLQAFPPAVRDRQYQEKFRPLGLLDEVSPYVTPAPELSAALRAGIAAGKAKIEYATGHGGDEVNGWRLPYHVFDYNADFFEIGALDDPQWIIQDRSTAYLIRAAAARAGLWGNHAYEAAYPMISKDADGNQLNGAHTYTLTFTQTPPVDAFWSITMYDTPDYYLVANPIDRYSIGDRTPGLVYGADGSLTITMSHDQPDEPANWLPAPAGDFRPVMRMYQPQAPVFDGTYVIPPVQRLGD